MAKFAPDAVMDGALAVIALADEMYVCSAQPSNYADIANSDLVGPIAMTPGNGNGDFTFADGDTSGRKVTVAAQSGSAIASGNATHIVLATGGATDLLRYITTCTSQAVTSGNTVNIPAWDVEFGDPT